eukprot:2247536-Pleurochrysis_carterae.AAC.1
MNSPGCRLKGWGGHAMRERPSPSSCASESIKMLRVRTVFIPQLQKALQNLFQAWFPPSSWRSRGSPFR